MNTNFISMTIICFMLFLTVLILSTGLAYKDHLKSGLEQSTKFDATIYNFKYQDSKHTMEEELKKMNFDFSKVEKYVFFNRYKINCDLDSKIGERLERDSLAYFKNYLSAISISDFNNIRRLKGENPVKLQENNVIITSDSLYIKNQLDKLLEKKEEVKINNIIYHIQDVCKEAIKTSITSQNEIIVIVPDDVVNNSRVIAEYLNVIFDTENKTELSRKYQKLFTASKEGAFRSENIFLNVDTKESIYLESKQVTTIIIFIGIYLGVIF